MTGTTFSLGEMSKVDFSIRYTEMDPGASQKHHDTHVHKECEIYVNLSGNVSFEVENHIYPISRGSVIITRPFEYHHCLYHSNDRHDHFWIIFSADEKQEFLEMFFDREKGKNNLILLDEEQLNEACRLMTLLTDDKADSLSRRILFLQLMQVLRQSRTGTGAGVADTMPNDIVLALRFMDDHLTEDVDVVTLAAACNVSVNTLERHMKHTLGITPFAMLRKKRLIASLAWLREGDSVTEAALKSGFSDYSNYIQLFRKQFGLTPLQYQKKFERI